MTGENIEGNIPDDRIDAVEALHNEGHVDLHFRFIGTAKGRHFIVNVQFDCEDGKTKELLQPVEYDFMMGKILELVRHHLVTRPNPAMH